MSLLTKTTWAIILLTLVSLFISEFLSPAHGSTNGAPAGRTGSPGDVFNCTSCHSGTPSTVAGLITSTIPLTGYLPGQTYTLTGNITSIGKTKFGFQISPQDVSGLELGTLVITDPTNTKLVGTSGNYVTHLTAGTSFPSGIATWSFDWIAPAAGTGDVTFYGAFNITNNNSIASGDVIRLSTLLAQEDVSSGINNEAKNQEEWIVYPNPTKDIIYISSKTNVEIESLSIFDIKGNMIEFLTKNGLANNHEIDLSHLKSGLYFLNIKTNKGESFKKIIKI